VLRPAVLHGFGRVRVARRTAIGSGDGRPSIMIVTKRFSATHTHTHTRIAKPAGILAPHTATRCKSPILVSTGLSAYCRIAGGSTVRILVCLVLCTVPQRQEDGCYDAEQPTAIALKLLATPWGLALLLVMFPAQFPPRKRAMCPL
jgi:hypothetical protein